jgi:hypothetical protein
VLCEAVFRDCNSRFWIDSRQLAAPPTANAVVTMLMELGDLISENLGEHPSRGLVYTEATTEPAWVVIARDDRFRERLDSVDVTHRELTQMDHAIGGRREAVAHAFDFERMKTARIEEHYQARF